MLNQGYGKIINTASMASLIGEWWELTVVLQNPYFNYYWCYLNQLNLYCAKVNHWHFVLEKMYYKNFIDTIFQHLSVLSILEHLLFFIEEVGLKLSEADTFDYVRKALGVIHVRELPETPCYFFLYPKGLIHSGRSWYMQESNSSPLQELVDVSSAESVWGTNKPHVPYEVVSRLRWKHSEMCHTDRCGCGSF